MNKAKNKDNDAQNLHKRETVSKKTKSEVKEEKKETNTTTSQANPPQEQQQGGFSMLKYMCIAFLIIQVCGSIYQMYFLFFPPLELNIEESPDKYINFMKHGQPFNLTIYLMDEHQRIHSKIWEEPFLTYNFSEKYPLVKELELPITQGMKANKTAYLIAELKAPNFYYGIHREKPIRPLKKDQHAIGHRVEDSYEVKGVKRPRSDKVTKRTFVFQSKLIPLVKYDKSFEIVEKNLMDSDLGTESSVKVSDDSTIYPHLKSMISVTLVHDTHGYFEGEFAAKQMGEYVRDSRELYYSPMFYLSDFWTLKRHFVRINETTDKLNMTLYFSMVSPGKHMFSKALHMYEAYPDILEELKEILSDANVYLLAITMVVTLLHSLLDMLSFKNDIQFWMNNKSFKGISVKSVFVQIGFDVILFLYMWDNSKQSSTYILVTMGISMLIDAWKVTRVCKFSLKNVFPYVQITYQQEYTESKTDSLDTKAIKFMSYLLFPCFLAYCVYSFLYKPHKGYYSYVISTLAGAVYLFGFILMTPQLYINYKLKSVAHLPWRALFYKFLNTIIDDLFSFVIKMPTMHRIACFRDDVIFVIYIYQRYAYKVDPKRSHLEEEEAKN